MSQDIEVGDLVTADMLSQMIADMMQDPFNTVILATDSGSLSSTESVSLVLLSKTYKAGKAYRVWIGGGITHSVVGAFTSYTLRKGTAVAGAAINTFTRQAGGTTQEQHLNIQGIFVVGATDVTTQLCLSIAVNNPNTAVHKGTTTNNPRHLTILPAGDASNWSGMPTLS